MPATYTPALVSEWFAATAALNAVPAGQDYLAERERLTDAEAALMVEGWRNEETEAEMRAMLPAAK